MAGKPKGVPRDTTITLRLPRELHDYIKEVARDRSVSEEIRQRLIWSQWRDNAADQKTRDLAEIIANLARNIRPYCGEWHENPYAFTAFKVALDTVLSKVRPKGQPVAPDIEGWRPGDTPEQIGVSLGTTEIIARGL